MTQLCLYHIDIYIGFTVPLLNILSDLYSVLLPLIRKHLASHKDGPSTTHMAAQPIQYNKIVTKQRTRSNSNPDHIETSHPEHFIQANQEKDTSNRGARQKDKT